MHSLNYKPHCTVAFNKDFYHFLVPRGCVCSVVSDSLPPHGLWPATLLCPWSFPGKNTGVGCHFLLQEFFLTQGSNPYFCVSCIGKPILYQLPHLGSPSSPMTLCKCTPANTCALCQMEGVQKTVYPSLLTSQTQSLRDAYG